MRTRRKGAFAVSCVALLLLAERPAIAQAEPRTTVAVSGQVSATILFPGGPLPIVLVLRAEAQGADSTELSGAGGHVALARGRFFLESSLYDLDLGFVDGNVVTLSGIIRDSMAPGLIGSPVVITGNTWGDITVTNGPIPGGPFAGQTHVFIGSGTVIINQ